jgi:hypothetical protein
VDLSKLSYERVTLIGMPPTATLASWYVTPYRPSFRLPLTMTLTVELRPLPLEAKADTVMV